MNWTQDDLNERDRKLAGAQGFVGALTVLATAQGGLPTLDRPAQPKRTPRTHPERDLERAGSRILQLDGWRLLKTDPVSDRRRGKGFGEIGMADCLYIRYWSDTRSTATVLWIEWKAPGGQATAAQRLWIAAERARGALVWLAGADFPASLGGFLDHYARNMSRAIARIRRDSGFKTGE